MRYRATMCRPPATPLLASLLLVGCKASPPANPAFDDAARYLLRVFDSGTDAERAYGVRQLERQSYLNMDLEASNPANRSVEPAPLQAEDVADLDHPGRDLGLNLPLALGFLSDYPVDDHARVFLLEDMTPIEPSSPDIYDRTFLEGEDCWLQPSCSVLRTYNDVERANILYDLRFDLYKDYRWVDLNLPDPADVPEGEEAVNDGEPRWALYVRSWVPESVHGDGATLWQSFAIEIWVPRDCQGFVRDGSEDNRDGGDWTTDSCTGDGGTMRMQALWTETELGTDVSDDVKQAATRTGIDGHFEATEDWLAEH